MVSTADQVWHATLNLVERRGSFTVADVMDALGDESPTKRTVLTRLDAMESLGLLSSEGGSGRASRVFFPPTPYRDLSRVERDMLFAIAHAVGDDGVAESVSAVADATGEVTACASQVLSASKYVRQLADHGLVDKHNTDNVGEPTAVSLTNAGLWALAERRDELQRAIREVLDSDE